MYTRILVPLNGSALSERVLPYARYLAQAFDTAVELIYAVAAIEDIPDQVAVEVAQDADAYLQQMADSFSKGLRPKCTVKTGPAAGVIVEQAATRRGTLVVMSTHGYTGPKRWMLGSVAHKVVQHVQAPVLLIPVRAKGPDGGLAEFKSLIAPLDGSPVAEHILPHVVSLCKKLDIELILVRAYHPSFPGTSVRMHDISRIVHDAAENYVREKARQLQSEGLKKISYKILRGVPSEQISDLALEIPNSLTAMCTRGKHGLGRLDFGSVTNAVIHSASEPVLILRGPGQDG
jgi:nucleotide-binding universal stress UspA family protein